MSCNCYVQVYIRTQKRTCTHTRTCMCSCVKAHTCTQSTQYTYVYTHTCSSGWQWKHIDSEQLPRYLVNLVLQWVLVNTYCFPNIWMYACKYWHIHTHICAYTHATCMYCIQTYYSALLSSKPEKSLYGPFVRSHIQRCPQPGHTAAPHLWKDCQNRHGDFPFQVLH